MCGKLKLVKTHEHFFFLASFSYLNYLKRYLKQEGCFLTFMKDGHLIKFPWLWKMSIDFFFLWWSLWMFWSPVSMPVAYFAVSGYNMPRPPHSRHNVCFRPFIDSTRQNMLQKDPIKTRLTIIKWWIKKSILHIQQNESIIPIHGYGTH